jgi:hypothetical protein
MVAHSRCHRIANPIGEQCQLVNHGHQDRPNLPIIQTRRNPIPLRLPNYRYMCQPRHLRSIRPAITFWKSARVAASCRCLRAKQVQQRSRHGDRSHARGITSAPPHTTSCAICTLDTPSAASSGARERCTIRNGAVCGRARVSSPSRSPSDNDSGSAAALMPSDTPQLSIQY